ncbi:EamA family transporter RarD [Haloferula sp. BvORR071]|uniref:EamA family transporter RarD n=1 Tax=Haloferula sp. BvORR071 TaxID=1396141 RepID=UPI00054E1B49|nr:EamA family transporter RarD [Haloferula sp. BvORR071]
MKERKDGVISAVAAFLMWGVLPIFWKGLIFLPPVTIIAQRTVWSLVLLAIVIGLQRQTGKVLRGLASWRSVGWHLLSGGLLASNWLLYVWATLNGHILEAALGYYLNPFLNMLFGAMFFGERQTRLQMLAVAVAAAGVAIQVYALRGIPWIALVLALTFALYGVVRKRAPLEALPGLTAETILLAPLALGWLIWENVHGVPVFGGNMHQAGLVVFTGVATALPLLCFGHAARTIRLTTLGILQFMAPTLQFVIGWKFYGEPMTQARLMSFALIWTAVAVYAADALTRGKRKAAPDEAAS